jgi:hypothetical protein
MKYSVLKQIASNLCLLCAMTLTTWGLVTWTVQNFSLVSLWPLSGPFMLHPVHVLALGAALLPIAFRIGHTRVPSTVNPAPVDQATADQTAVNQAHGSGLTHE